MLRKFHCCCRAPARTQQTSADMPTSVQPCPLFKKSKVAAARPHLVCTPSRPLKCTRNPGSISNTQRFKASSLCNTCCLPDVTHSIPTCWLTVRSVPRGCTLWLHRPQLEFSETWHKPSVSAYAVKVFSELCNGTKCRIRNRDYG